MDMGMPADPAVANLPLSDPACVRAAEGCIAFYAAENASQAAIPWASLFEYGHWTTYYYVVIIGLLFVWLLFQRLLESRVISLPDERPLFDKGRAFGRKIFYRYLTPTTLRIQLDLPANYGVWAFLVITIVYLTAVAFGPRPYYREHLGFGSPPLAVRTGLMSLACLPITVALSGKANVVTLFTGISHERLNIIHRWVSWMSFVLALIHTIPFFYAAEHDEGWGGLERETYEFYKGGFTGDNQLNGVPPLAVLFGICVISIPAIRDRFHESFWLGHVVLAITYLGTMFWHATGGDSWAYLWATLAIWLSSWFARIFWKTQQLNLKNDWFDGAPLSLTVLPGNITRMDIFTPHSFRWKPGQHVFVRFPAIEPLASHPFTIASPCSVTHWEDNSIVLLARAHSGLTRRLLDHTQQTASSGRLRSVKVWLDGPYGGLAHAPERRYETLLLVVGGTGISSSLPWLLDSIARAGEHGIKLRHVVLVWSIRHIDALYWIQKELMYVAECKKELKGLSVVVRIHVTGSNPPSVPVADDVKRDMSSGFSPSDDDNEEIGTLSSDKLQGSSGAATDLISSVGTRVIGRPNFQQIVGEFAAEGERTMVLGCGPGTFKSDLANAVASAQSGVLAGRQKEIAMHLETYGW